MLLLSIFSILLYLYALLSMYKKYGNTQIVYYYVAFFQLWTVVSVFYNDLGIHNIELYQDTYVSTATIYLSSFYILFHIGFLSTHSSRKLSLQNFILIEPL